jgi:hypothetical protein
MDKDTAKLIRQAKAKGWFLDARVGSHNQRWLRCPGGCKQPVYSTRRGNQPAKIRRILRKCRHGYEMDV